MKVLNKADNMYYIYVSVSLSLKANKLVCVAYFCITYSKNIKFSYKICKHISCYKLHHKIRLQIVKSKE